MRFTFTFPPHEDAPAQARRSLEILEPILRPEVRENLELVVTELVTNSVRHGPAAAITLQLDISDDGAVHGEVADLGEGDPALIAITAEPSVDGGWGLYLVDRIASAWGVRDSSCVWFELRR